MPRLVVNPETGELDYVDTGSGGTGPQGPQGPPGPPGVDGADGAEGPPGPTGPQGPTGATGAAGATGAQGPQGIPGLDGDDGVDGTPGPQGPQGPQGTTGATGATGPQGSQGVMGPMGLDGDDGVAGPPGPVGPRGARGTPGMPGIDGQDPSEFSMAGFNVPRHSQLTGLTDGDAGHTQFLKLTGRSGGQIAQGGTGNSEDLTLESTAGSTKGLINAKDELRLRTSNATSSAASTDTFAAQLVAANTHSGANSTFFVLGLTGTTTMGANSGIVEGIGFGTLNNPYRLVTTINNSSPEFRGIEHRAIIRADGATGVGASHTGFNFQAEVDRINSGTITGGALIAIVHDPTVNAGCTMDTITALSVNGFAGAGAVTTQRAIRIIGFDGATTNITLDCSTATATMRHAGGAHFGGTTAPSEKLQVTGNMLGSGNLTLGTAGTNCTATVGQGTTGTDNATLTINGGNGGGVASMKLQLNATDAFILQTAALGIIQFGNGSGIYQFWNDATFTTDGFVLNTGKVSRYQNIATVGNGVPSQIATIDLTAQGAAIGSTLLYAVPAARGGLYRISYVATVTRAASTSSTLGGAGLGVQIDYTDNDTGVAKLTPAGAAVAAGTNATLSTPTNAANTTAAVISGCIVVSAQASTNINYRIGYTSAGATTMQYNLHIRIEAL